MKFALAATIFVAIQLIVFAEDKQCTKPEDCEADECCVLPIQARFVRPICHKRRQVNEECRPNAQEESASIPLSPNTNDKLEVTGAYRALCPCLANLHCHAGKCTSS